MVLAHALYLPAAQCFALVPGMHGLRRSGDPGAANVDYDADSGSVVLTSGSALRCAVVCSSSYHRKNNSMGAIARAHLHVLLHRSAVAVMEDASTCAGKDDDKLKHLVSSKAFT